MNADGLIERITRTHPRTNVMPATFVPSAVEIRRVCLTFARCVRNNRLSAFICVQPRFPHTTAVPIFTGAV